MTAVSLQRFLPRSVVGFFLLLLSLLFVTFAAATNNHTNGTDSPVPPQCSTENNTNSTVPNDNNNNTSAPWHCQPSSGNSSNGSTAPASNPPTGPTADPTPLPFLASETPYPQRPDGANEAKTAQPTLAPGATTATPPSGKDEEERDVRFRDVIDNKPLIAAKWPIVLTTLTCAILLCMGMTLIRTELERRPGSAHFIVYTVVAKNITVLGLVAACANVAAASFTYKDEYAFVFRWAYFALFALAVMLCVLLGVTARRIEGYVQRWTDWEVHLPRGAVPAVADGTTAAIQMSNDVLAETSRAEFMPLGPTTTATTTRRTKFTGKEFSLITQLKYIYTLQLQHMYPERKILAEDVRVTSYVHRIEQRLLIQLVSFEWKNWIVIVVFTVFNAFRQTAIMSSAEGDQGITQDTRLRDALTFVFVMGAIPVLLFVVFHVNIVRNTSRYLDASVEQLAYIERKRAKERKLHAETVARLTKNARAAALHQQDASPNPTRTLLPSSSSSPERTKRMKGGDDEICSPVFKAHPFPKEEFVDPFDYLWFKGPGICMAVFRAGVILSATYTAFFLTSMAYMMLTELQHFTLGIFLCALALAPALLCQYLLPWSSLVLIMIAKLGPHLDTRVLKQVVPGLQERRWKKENEDDGDDSSSSSSSSSDGKQRKQKQQQRVSNPLRKFFGFDARDEKGSTKTDKKESRSRGDDTDDSDDTEMQSAETGGSSRRSSVSSSSSSSRPDVYNHEKKEMKRKKYVEKQSAKQNNSISSTAKKKGDSYDAEEVEALLRDGLASASGQSKGESTAKPYGDDLDAWFKLEEGHTSMSTVASPFKSPKEQQQQFQPLSGGKEVADRDALERRYEDNLERAEVHLLRLIQRQEDVHNSIMDLAIIRRRLQLKMSNVLAAIERREDLRGAFKQKLSDAQVAQALERQVKELDEAAAVEKKKLAREAKLKRKAKIARDAVLRAARVESDERAAMLDDAGSQSSSTGSDEDDGQKTTTTTGKQRQAWERSRDGKSFLDTGAASGVPSALRWQLLSGRALGSVATFSSSAVDARVRGASGTRERERDTEGAAATRYYSPEVWQALIPTAAESAEALPPREIPSLDPERDNPHTAVYIPHAAYARSSKLVSFDESTMLSPEQRKLLRTDEEADREHAEQRRERKDKLMERKREWRRKQTETRVELCEAEEHARNKLERVLEKTVTKLEAKMGRRATDATAALTRREREEEEKEAAAAAMKTSADEKENKEGEDSSPESPVSSANLSGFSSGGEGESTGGNDESQPGEESRQQERGGRRASSGATSAATADSNVNVNASNSDSATGDAAEQQLGPRHTMVTDWKSWGSDLEPLTQDDLQHYL